MQNQYHYIINGKKSYYCIDIEDKKYLKNHLKHYLKISPQKGKPNVVEKNKILSDKKFLSILKKYYIDKQIGIKSIVKLIDNVITYSSLRSILKTTKMLREGNNYEFTCEQKKCRKYNAINGITPTIEDNDISVYSNHSYHKSNKQGIQGYYFSKCLNKFVWLRSTFEYMLIDYFDRYNIMYTYEEKEYILKDGRKYRPDFHLYIDGFFNSIIEVKSRYYVSHQDDKPLLLKDEQNIDVKILSGIEEIRDYTQKKCKSYNKARLEWKLIKITGENLNEIYKSKIN